MDEYHVHVIRNCRAFVIQLVYLYLSELSAVVAHASKRIYHIISFIRQMQ